MSQPGRLVFVSRLYCITIIAVDYRCSAYTVKMGRGLASSSEFGVSLCRYGPRVLPQKTDVSSSFIIKCVKCESIV